MRRAASVMRESAGQCLMAQSSLRSRRRFGYPYSMRCSAVWQEGEKIWSRGMRLPWRNF